MKTKFFTLALCLLTITGFAQDQTTKQEIITKNIEVGFNKTTLIFLDSEIDFWDVGSEDLLFEKTSKPNIARLKAAVEGFAETNLTITTMDGQLFSLIVKYNPNPAILNQILTKSGKPVFLNKEEVKEVKAQESILKDFDFVESKVKGETLLNTLTQFDYKMGLGISGIFVYKGNIYMNVVVTNKSSIDYNVDALMFSIQQKRKKAQATTSQDVYLQPIHTKNIPTVFKANQEYSNILVCFSSFTISNQNILSVELLEKSGSRNLKVDLQSKNLLSAKIIN